jgi:hypothetical protein
MQIKVKSNTRCLWCKEKIKVDDSVSVYKGGLIVHNGECKDEILKLAEKWKRDNNA